MAAAKKSEGATATVAKIKPALEGLPFDAYEILEMRRSEVKGAPYNPRIITDAEKKRLRVGLGKHKMVTPPTWNRRTGNLVGGHQRLSALDVLAGGADYSLKVAVIDVSEAEEKEINILLNNPQAMGDWDMPKLEEMLQDPNIDLKGTGFDMADVFRLFGDAPGATSQELTGLADSLRAARQKYDDSIQKTGEKASVDFYIVVVFRDHEDRDRFLAALQLEPNRYQDGRTLQALLAAGEQVKAELAALKADARIVCEGYNGQPLASHTEAWARLKAQAQLAVTDGQ